MLPGTKGIRQAALEAVARRQLRRGNAARLGRSVPTPSGPDWGMQRSLSWPGHSRECCSLRVAARPRQISGLFPNA